MNGKELKDIEPIKFENVTLYINGMMFGVSRIDCRTLEIREGYKYAQYNNAVHIQFVEKGKRKPRAIVITSLPFAVIVATKNAIQPAHWMDKNEDGSSVSRYASCDPRYETDFLAKLQAANVPVLREYCSWNAHDSFSFYVDIDDRKTMGSRKYFDSLETVLPWLNENAEKLADVVILQEHKKNTEVCRFVKMAGDKFEQLTPADGKAISA